MDDITQAKLARALYHALKRTSPRAAIDEPFEGETSVVDGCFDLFEVASELEKALQEENLRIVSGATAA